MSDENQIIEDVEEKDLVENQELEAEETEQVVEETTEEVSEEIEVAEEQQPLDDTVLDILLGEAKKKNEEEDSDEEEDSSEEDDDDEEEEVKEGAHEDEEEDEEDVKEGAHEDDDEDEVEEGEHEDDDSEDSDDDSDEDEEEQLPEVTTKAGYLAASFGALKGMRKSELVSAYKAVNPVVEGEHEEDQEIPKTKADIINAMYGQLKAMKKDDLMASYKSIMASHCESVKEETEADLFADDLKVLADADQELTEDFKSKAAILFEGAVANRVIEIKEQLEAQYLSDLQEEVTYVRESLVSKIDDYMSYVVESWIEDNQEYVDNKLRTEITENFMKALQGVFTEHYIEVPEGKVDLVDELSDEVTSIKESLEASEASNRELKEKVEELERSRIIAEATTDLTTTQKEKLASLVEEVEYVDAESFAAKVETIKESFFNESETKEEELTESVDSTEVETIVEGAGETKLPADMAKYVATLSRFK